MGYKMTNDTGFAPNPFHGNLTLATCKPSIRRARQQGDWIAGFVSRQLVRNAAAAGVKIQYMGLIYLAEITEKPLPLGEYFQDSRFAGKKPNLGSSSPRLRCGDNIYSVKANGCFRWWPNDHHDSSAMPHDTGGRNALISSRFWYFGRNAFTPNEGWQSFLPEPISGARTFQCPQSFLQRVLERFSELDIHPGVQADPCIWEVSCAGDCSKVKAVHEEQGKASYFAGLRGYC